MLQINYGKSVFGYCNNIIGGNGTTFNSEHLDKEYARIDKEGTPGYFTDINKGEIEEETNRLMLANYESETYLDSGVTREKIENITFAYGEVPNTGVISFFDASEKQNGSITGYYTDADSNGMYELTFISTEQIYSNINSTYLFGDLINVKTINFDNFSTKGTTNMEDIFCGVKNVTYIDLSSFDTKNVTNMCGMFQGCINLINLNLNSFDTQNVTDMSGMFYNCNSLTEINLSNFDTSNVTNMKYMFNQCISIPELDLSKINTSKVTDMSWMFFRCESISRLDLSSFDTSNVTTMEGMIADCTNLIDLNVSNFNTSNVTNMCAMFEYLPQLTNLDVSSFDTSNVTDMSWMFWSCINIQVLDISNFNTSKVTDMSYMFTDIDNYGGLQGIVKLKTIYVSEYNEDTNTGWTTKSVKNSKNMFFDCKNLVGGNGTIYDESYIDATYAKIDEEGSPGYLTNIKDKQ